jgi:hypothetical protein
MMQIAPMPANRRIGAIPKADRDAVTSGSS